ncbi:MAG: hypothetical protein ACAH11_01735 [Sphingomonas sp.]
MSALLLLAAFALQPAPGPSLGEVIPGPKRYFHKGEEQSGCPALTAKCRRAGYLVPGDRIVVWERRGALTHVEFVSAKGVHSEGWIETVGLKTVPLTAAPLVAWQGDWGAVSGHLTITRSPRAGRLLVTGFAMWRQNDGEIAGEILPTKNYAAFATGDLDEPGGVIVPDGMGGSSKSFPFTAPGEDRCRVEMWLRLPYLVVVDQGRCGGLNVSFSGVYRK